MAVTLSDINTLINDRRRDSSSDTIDMTAEGFRAINSVLRIWQQNHDWPFTIETQTINYNPGINRYNLNSDFKAEIDLTYNKPSRTQEFALVSEGNFYSETTKKNRWAIDDKEQDQHILIQASKGFKSQIHTLSSIDSNGTWIASGAASSLEEDSFETFELSGSLKFTMSGTAAVLTITDMSQVDLERFVNRGNIYVDLELESVTNFTNLQIEIGNDSSNFFSETVTTDYLGDSVDTTGWNKFKFNPWSSETGSVTLDEVDYVKLTLTYSSDPSQTVRIENLFVSENIPIDLEYYSINMVTQVSDSTKHPIFQDSSNTNDTVLWSEYRDFVTETFINNVLEIIFWMSGEYTDRQVAIQNILEDLEMLKRKMPSRRREPEMQMYVE